MKAVRVHAFGGPEVMSIDEIPMPTAGEREVLFRLGATSVNPVDYKTREGQVSFVKQGWKSAGPMCRH
jgi:NADPH:quinone reductase-like Zn-dependent oxidoreductase